MPDFAPRVQGQHKIGLTRQLTRFPGWLPCIQARSYEKCRHMTWHNISFELSSSHLCKIFHGVDHGTPPAFSILLLSSVLSSGDMSAGPHLRKSVLYIQRDYTQSSSNELYRPNNNPQVVLSVLISSMYPTLLCRTLLLVANTNGTPDVSEPQRNVANDMPRLHIRWLSEVPEKSKYYSMCSLSNF